MPRGDRTGPVGMGSMLSKGMGICASLEMPVLARGGFGMGHGHGFRRMHYATGMPGCVRYGACPFGTPNAGAVAAPVSQEKEVLQNQAAFLEMQLKNVQERLKNNQEV